MKSDPSAENPRETRRVCSKNLSEIFPSVEKLAEQIQKMSGVSEVRLKKPCKKPTTITKVVTLNHDN
jgi:hypothetical protein